MKLLVKFTSVAFQSIPSLLSLIFEMCSNCKYDEDVLGTSEFYLPGKNPNYMTGKYDNGYSPGGIYMRDGT